MTKEEIKVIFEQGRKNAKDLFAQRLAPRLAILDKLEEEAKKLEEKTGQSEEYKEGVQLVLEMIANKRELYEEATSLMRLQLIAPADNNDVDTFVTAIDSMMGAIKDLAK